MGMCLRVGELEELRLDVVLGLEAVALDLDVKPVAEHLLEAVEPRFGEAGLAVAQGAVDGAVGAAGERNEAIGVRGDDVRRRMRRLDVGGIEMRAADELHQVGVAGVVHRQQRDVAVAGLAYGRHAALGPVVAAIFEVDREADADDRLDAGVRQLVGELQRAVEVVGVGEAQRRKLCAAASFASLPISSAPSSSE